MAEAHSAVAFSFAITHEGVDVNFDREVLHLVWKSGLRSWRKTLIRVRNSIYNGVYPAHLCSLWITMSGVSALHLHGYQIPYNPVSKIMPLLPGTSIKWQIVGCSAIALTIWLSVIHSIRYSLKWLLMYKGWMFERRSPNQKHSLTTKMWSIIVDFFVNYNKPKLYSFQGSLPCLPLPSLRDTMKRYLRSVRPLLDDKDYEKSRNLCEEFENGIGIKLQRYLKLKSWWSTNYVSDWWEEYVYLRGRSPLMVNSNFYGIDAIFMKGTDKQSVRAGSLIYSALCWRRNIERQEVEPIMIQNKVPLCSAQYERVFNTTRIPGLESDKIQHLNDSNHIVVYHKGRYFKVVIYKDRILNPAEIQIQIEQILSDLSEPLPGEEKLAALTAGYRTHWAETRRKFFNKGVNKQSLDQIEKSAFVVILDDFPYEFDEPEKLDLYGKMLLHGKGYDRWFDKSFNLCIGSNGRNPKQHPDVNFDEDRPGRSKIGFNAEHSWADAAVMSHLWEHVLLSDCITARADAPIVAHLCEFCFSDELTGRYDDQGDLISRAEIVPPSPVRLQWHIVKDCQDAINESLSVCTDLINDVDLKILKFDVYGKGFMKKCKVSPDAYIQMALQLAYYRNAGKFCFTYEASMTRLFREGRTETVRPCTIESVAWSKAMDDEEFTTDKKIELLRAACQQHQLAYQNAMIGNGIDRHLFCLYVVSRYLDVESPFLKEVLSEPWRLSTSQTPHGQTPRMDLKKYPNCISAGGGFGPVADDGYGVSYIIAGEDLVFFHVSAKVSASNTDCGRFVNEIRKALFDMRTLFSANQTKSITIEQSN